MQNFADLVLGADTTGLDRAVTSLDEVVVSGGKAEKSTKGVEGGFKSSGNAAAAASSKVKQFSAATEQTNKMALAAARSLGLLVSGYIGFGAAASSVSQARGFNAALAETSTLIKGTPQQMKLLADSARELTIEFGGQASDKVTAYYQAISSGASSVKEATKTLSDANKLAVGGVASLSGSVAILSGVVNTYGKEAITTSQASDTLFIGVKQGVTTVSELTASIGKVLPTAKALGLSFEEVVSATAALTKNNLKTSEAVVSLNAALVGIIKPTKEATDLASELGLEFNSAGLKAQGLEVFLANVVEKTNGNVAAMSQLFGSVEALKAALLFAGEAGGQYSEILEEMATKAGATEEAFNKVASSLDQRWSRAMAALSDLTLATGSTLLNVAVPALEALASILTFTADNADILAISLGVLALTRVPALIAGLVTLSAWLATSEGLFIAGAFAAKGMALAMRLIPFVAVVAGATSMYRAYTSQKEAAELAANTQRQLNHQLGLYAETAAPAARNAAVELLRVQIESSRAKLMEMEATKQLMEEQFGAGSMDDTPMGRAVEEFRNQLDNLSMTVSGLLRGSVEETSEVMATLGTEVGSLGTSLEEVTAKAYTVIPAFAELQAQYGANADAMLRVLEAQNAIAASDAAAGMREVAQSALNVAENLNLSSGEATNLYLALYDIVSSDSLQGQAVAAANVAEQLFIATGGAHNMDAATRDVYISLLNAAEGASSLGQQIAVARLGSSNLAAAVARIAPQFVPAINAANTLARAIGGAISQLGGLGKGLLNLSATASAVAKVTGSAGGFLKGFSASAISGATTGLSGVAKNLISVANEASKTGATTVKLKKHLDNLVSPTTGGSGGGSGGGRSRGGAAKKLAGEAGEAAKALREAEREAKRLRDALDRPMITVVDGFAKSIGDFVAGGLRDFKKLGEGILNSITSAISQAITFAIANPIKVALGLRGGLTGGTQAAGGLIPSGGGLGGLGNIGGVLTKGIGTFFGGFGGSGLGGVLSGGGLSGLAGGTGFLGGLGNTLGGFASGGLSGGFSAIGSALSGATSGLAGLGAAVGAIALPVLAVTALFSFFKKKTTELDAGIKVTISELDSMVETFSVIETKRFWGLSKKVTTAYTAADDDVAAPLIAIVGSIQDSILSSADSLGFASSAFKGFAHELEVSTKGLSDEDAQAAVEEALIGLGDAFADMIPDIEEYQRASESSTEALTRMSQGLLAANDAMDLLGNSLFEVSLAGGDAASELVEAFGGLDSMTAAISSYFSGFYTEEERFETTMRRLNSSFESLGVVMPSTRDGFRELVESIDISSSSGRELYAELILLSGAMNEVLPVVSKFSADMLGLLSEIGGELGEQITNSQALQRVAESNASLWYRTAETLRRFLSDLLQSDLTSSSQAQRTQANQIAFNEAMTSAMAGNQESADEIPELARNLLGDIKRNSSSEIEYRRRAANIQLEVLRLSGVSEIEGANEDVLASLYERQIEVLNSLANFIELGSLTDEQLALLGSDIQEAFLNWDDTMNTFDSSLASLEAAIEESKNFSYEALKERLNVSVDLIAGADIPDHVKALLQNAQEGIRANVEFIVLSDLTPDQKWIALQASSDHLATIDFAVGEDLTVKQRELLAESVSDLHRNLYFSVKQDIDSEYKSIALAKNLSVSRKLVLKMDSSNSDLMAFNVLEALDAAAGSTIQIAAGVSLDPSEAFKVWYSDSTQEYLSTPMEQLRAKLTDLKNAVRSDIDSREKQAQKTAAINAAQAAADMAVQRWQNSVNQTKGIQTNIIDLEASTGVDLMYGALDAFFQGREDGTVWFPRTHVMSNSSSDLEGFRSQFWADGGLEDQFNSSNQQTKALFAELQSYRESLIDLGVVPAFAQGGIHRGGVARIGENDIELVAPSRIYNPRETRDMFDQSKVVEAIDGMSKTIEEMQAEQRQLGLSIEGTNKRMSNVFQKWDRNGIPAERENQ